MLISVFAFIWQTYIIIAFFLFFFNEAGQQKNKMEIFVFLKLLCVMNGLIDRNKKEENKMSKLSSVLKKTGIAVAAAAMLVTMGAGTVVTQAKTSLPVYKVSLAKKYTDHQKDKRMEASVKIPKVKITGTDGKVMKSESEKLNAAISSYQNKFIKDYKKDVADVKKGEKGNESLTSGYKVVTDNDKMFCLRIDTVIAMGGSQSYAKIFSVDKKSGKQITLKNLFKKGSGYIDRISDNIKEQMRAQMKENADVTYFVDDENNKFNFKSISNKTNFYVNEKGKLTLVFDKYEVAPGYMGMVEFSIPTGEIVDMVTNGYLK